MTAEEIREKALDAIWKSAFNEEGDELDMADFEAAYEAGRSAGLNEAAGLMRLEASTNAEGRRFAAAIRAIKP